MQQQNFAQHVAKNPVNMVSLSSVVMYDVSKDGVRLIGVGTRERGRKFDEEFRCIPMANAQIPELEIGSHVTVIGMICEGKIWAPAMVPGVGTGEDGEAIRTYGPSVDENGVPDGAEITSHFISAYGIVPTGLDPYDTERAALSQVRGHITGEGIIGKTGNGRVIFDVPMTLDNGAQCYLHLVDIMASNRATKPLEIGKTVSIKGAVVEHQFNVVEKDLVDLLESIPVTDENGNEVRLVDDKNNETVLAVKPHRYLITPKMWREYLGNGSQVADQAGGTRRRVVRSTANEQADIINQFVENDADN